MVDVVNVTPLSNAPGTPLQMTIHPPSVSAGRDFSSDLGLTGGGTQAAPTGADATPQGKDFSGDLGLSPKMTADMTNDDILKSVGYKDADIAALKTDPNYKFAAKVSGDNFLAQEVLKPGSLAQAFMAEPHYGGFAHGASETAINTMKYLSLGLNKIGAQPDTSPAFFDAVSRVANATYHQGVDNIRAGLGVANTDAVPEFLGALALGGAGIVGAGAKVADATLAASKTVPLASRLLQAGKGLVATGTVGAVAAPMYDNSDQVKPSVGKAYNDAYGDHIGDDALWGAIFAAGAHTMIKGALAAGGVATKAENAARINRVLTQLRQGLGDTAQKYGDFVDSISKVFKDPEYAAREANFAANGVTPTYGDVTQSGPAKKLEKVSRNLPFGLDKFRGKTQQAQLQAATKRFSAQQYDQMINTKWGGLDELEQAAKGTGDYAKRAKDVLEILKNETGTPASRAIKADIGAQDVRRLLIKSKLFEARDQLAGSAAVRNDKPLAVVKSIMSEESKSGLPNKSFMQDMGIIHQFLDNGPSSQTYDKYVATRNSIDGMVGKYGGNIDRQLIRLKEAFNAALDDFSTNTLKYAKSERYGVTASNTKPFFSSGKGGGYSFKDMLLKGKDALDDNVNVYQAGFKTAANNYAKDAAAHQVNLRSPIIVEKGQGVAEFKAKLGLPEDVSDTELHKAAVDYAKGNGNDGIVMTANGVPQQIIDLTGWKRSIMDATNRANKFFKETYAPAVGKGGMMESSQNIIQQALNSQPDQIVSNMIKAGQTDKARTFFNSLGPRGQAAVRSQLIDKAIEAGTDVDGKINPAKVASALFKIDDEAKIFFTGENRWALDGFLKLMKHSEGMAPNAGEGGHIGSYIMLETLSSIMTGIIRGSVKEAVITAGLETGTGLAASKMVSAFATNQKLRHFLLAASDTNPGTAKMNIIYDKFKAQLANVMAETSTKVNEETKQ